MQVVKHHQRRRMPGEPFEEPGEGVEQAQSRRVGIEWALDRPGLAAWGSGPGQLRQKPGQLDDVGSGECHDFGRAQGGEEPT